MTQAGLDALGSALTDSDKEEDLGDRETVSCLVSPPAHLAVSGYEKAGLDPANGPDVAAVADGFRERAQTLAQMATSAWYCFEDFDEIDAKAAKKNLRPVILEPLKAVRVAFSRLDEWSKEAIARTIQEVAHEFEINMGKLGQPIRVAVTGGAVSPPIDVTIWLVGRERTLGRLDEAIRITEARAGA